MLSSSASLSLSARRNVGGGVAARKPVRVQMHAADIFPQTRVTGSRAELFFFSFTPCGMRARGTSRGGGERTRPCSWGIRACCRLGIGKCVLREECRVWCVFALAARRSFAFTGECGVVEKKLKKLYTPFFRFILPPSSLSSTMQVRAPVRAAFAVRAEAVSDSLHREHTILHPVLSPQLAPRFRRLRGTPSPTTSREVALSRDVVSLYPFNFSSSVFP